MVLLVLLVAIVFVGYVLIKKGEMQIALILAGFFLLTVAHFLGIDVMKESPGASGKAQYFVFDLFNFLKNSFTSTAAGIGLAIMSVGGFSAYMSNVGASPMLVKICVRALGFIKKPYVLLVAFFFLNQFLSMIITSATGLALLLMVTEYPLLRNLGISRYSGAGVIATSTMFEFGPLQTPTIFVGKILEMDANEYFLYHRLPVIVVLMIVAASAHFFWQKNRDKKEGYDSQKDSREELETNGQNEIKDVPVFYGFLPLLPFVMVLFFNKFTDKYLVKLDYNINLVVALLVSVVLSMVIDTIATGDPHKALRGWGHFVEGMSKVWSVVTLIVAASVFAAGIDKIGGVKLLVDTVSHWGLGGAVMTVVFSVVIFLVGAVTGSGNAPLLSLTPLIPEIAQHFGVHAVNMMVPSHFASSMGRTISPVAGVIIACSGLGKIPPTEVVKRTFVPVMITFVTMYVVHGIVNGYN